MWIVDLFGNQIFFPVSLFLYFYWKKNGQLPFPMVIPIEPILGIFGAPAPVITPDPPTPVNPPVNTPVTPPCNCPTCPPVNPPVNTPVTPVNPPTPAHPNYQQMARQAIGAMPIDVQWSTTVGGPGGGTNSYSTKEKTTIGGLPSLFRTFQADREKAADNGVQYSIDEQSFKISRVTPASHPLVQQNAEAYELQKLGYHGSHAQYNIPTIQDHPVVPDSISAIPQPRQSYDQNPAVANNTFVPVQQLFGDKIPNMKSVL